MDLRGTIEEITKPLAIQSPSATSRRNLKRVQRLFLHQLGHERRQIANSVNYPHYLNSIGVKLVEDQPPFVQKIVPSAGGKRVNVPRGIGFGVLVGELANLEVDLFAG